MKKRIVDFRSSICCQNAWHTHTHSLLFYPHTHIRMTTIRISIWDYERWVVRRREWRDKVCDFIHVLWVGQCRTAVCSEICVQTKASNRKVSHDKCLVFSEKLRCPLYRAAHKKETEKTFRPGYIRSHCYRRCHCHRRHLPDVDTPMNAPDYDTYLKLVRFSLVTENICI